MNSSKTIGLVAANAFAIIISLLTKILENSIGKDSISVIVSSQFIILPILMGIICAWFWRNTQMNTGGRFLYSFYNLLLICAWSWAFLHEGYICLIIVSPLVYACLVIGVFLGKVMFRNKNNTMSFSVLGLLVLIFVADVFSRHSFENVVGDTMIINAPPGKVWQYVVAYEPIKSNADYWLFNIGMPRPIASTVTGYAKGEGRKCVFHNGYVFDEVMTVYEPGKELTFDIIHQPPDPEIMGHIDILKGQFLLKDNGNGTTTLTGNSWYRLYVFPSWYYNIWAESITRNVHLRVMKHIKILAEN